MTIGSIARRNADFYYRMKSFQGYLTRAKYMKQILLTLIYEVNIENDV